MATYDVADKYQQQKFVDRGRRRVIFCLKIVQLAVLKHILNSLNIKHKKAVSFNLLREHLSADDACVGLHLEPSQCWHWDLIFVQCKHWDIYIPIVTLAV